jgi:hypothetical protein
MMCSTITSDCFIFCISYNTRDAGYLPCHEHLSGPTDNELSRTNTSFFLLQYLIAVLMSKEPFHVKITE